MWLFKVRDELLPSYSLWQRSPAPVCSERPASSPSWCRSLCGRLPSPPRSPHSSCIWKSKRVRAQGATQLHYFQEEWFRWLRCLPRESVMLKEKERGVLVWSQQSMRRTEIPFRFTDKNKLRLGRELHFPFWHKQHKHKHFPLNDLHMFSVPKRIALKGWLRCTPAEAVRAFRMGNMTSDVKNDRLISYSKLSWQVCAVRSLNCLLNSPSVSPECDPWRQQKLQFPWLYVTWKSVPYYTDVRV